MPSINPSSERKMCVSFICHRQRVSHSNHNHYLDCNCTPNGLAIRFAGMMICNPRISLMWLVMLRCVVRRCSQIVVSSVPQRIRLKSLTCREFNTSQSGQSASMCCVSVLEATGNKSLWKCHTLKYYSSVA